MKGISRDSQVLVTDSVSRHLAELSRLDTTLAKTGTRVWDASSLEKMPERVKAGSIYLVPVTIDCVARAFLEQMFSGRMAKCKRHRRIFSPVLSWTDDEMQLYAKIKRLPCPKAARYPMLDKLEDSYPGTKHALLRAMQKVGYL
jgi:hypothetical protein